jgi:hypothetical protein
VAITWLAVLKMWISFLSEYLVNAIAVFSSSHSKTDKTKAVYEIVYGHMHDFSLDERHQE